MARSDLECVTFYVQKLSWFSDIEALYAVHPQFLQNLKFFPCFDILGDGSHSQAVHNPYQGLHEELFVVVTIDVTGVAAVDLDVIERKVFQVSHGSGAVSEAVDGKPGARLPQAMNRGSQDIDVIEQAVFGGFEYEPFRFLGVLPQPRA